ncbi:liprin-beta-2 isoform X1 [Gadus chalcogrammus]|uniref:liprin-beta-2 isoform X1 n=2 Tax=Gadus chalcogrammus TaxID=1042646 RepID=UPI0024C48CE6|nr:liprin-beta-2 isoform X1 [Gadus chalcogrammus]
MEYNIDLHKHFTWLKKVNLSAPGNSTASYQERLSRLEGDKESLILQVGLLTDQVEAQGVKISGLLSSLEEYQHKLKYTEEMLQQELLNRTSLESQKLNLMGEVSYLKLKLADMEQNHVHGTERQHKAEHVVNFISELQEQMCKFQEEINSKIQEQRTLNIQADIQTDSVEASCPPASHEGQSSALGLSCDRGPGEMHPLADASGSSDENEDNDNLGESWSNADATCQCGEQSVLLKELRFLKDRVEVLEDQKSQYEKKLKATKVEISCLQQLLFSKNTEIDNLNTQLMARPCLPNENPERELELQKLRAGMETLLAANEEKNQRIEELTMLLKQCRQFREVPYTARQPPPTIRSLSNRRTESSSSEEEEQGGMVGNVDSSSSKSEDVKSQVSTSSLSSQNTSFASVQKEINTRTDTQTLSSSTNDLPNGPLEKSDHADTPPVNASLSEQSEDRERETERESSSDTQSRTSPHGSEDGDSNRSKPSGNAEGSDCSSGSSEAGAPASDRALGSPEYLKTNRSLRKLWGKLRRTQSGGLQGVDPDAGQFQRGGLRATAGPRLTRTPESHSSSRDMNTPFGQWSKEQVCGWLEDYGLAQYVNLTRQWVDNGQTLLSASPQDYEKEMGIKHPLHRKKLQLALKALSTKVVEKSSELDHIWVTRWLDDIGLPQYKDQFHEARVDGRMIQYLTVNDLLTLKVTSQLHHLSIKCAIHVLHANKFNPHCLRRRPAEEKSPSPSEVVQWSNHRVMEWLRAVDLAEYAPNLRGSGVHGGLVILEPRFSAETLALLLNIPPQKTLLRRHLASAFSSLVGAQATQEKREYANATGHVPLTTTAKVRPKKLGFTQFSHLRKKKPDDTADYICPIDSGVVPANGVFYRPYSGMRHLSPLLDRQSERQEKAGVLSGC